MYKTLLFILIMSSSVVYANLELAPPSFKTLGGKNAIFIDISRATHEFFFDNSREVKIKSKLSFEVNNYGHPLFDLVPETISSIKLNGVTTSQKLIQLPSKSSHPMRLVNKYLTPGEYSLEITHSLNKDFDFKKEKKGVSLLFKFCDGKGVRKLLERYLPANLQYDQYPVQFKLNFTKELSNQQIVANGEVRRKKNGLSYIIDFPSYYNSGSLFFHTFPRGKYKLHRESYRGIDIKLYTAKLNSLATAEFYLSKVRRKMDKFEKTMGPWPTNEFIVFLGENFSGIEHAGATRTSLYSLDHEMFHMYFGRGVMPSDGRSAWIDEGLARWKDGGSYLEIGRKKPFRQYADLPEGFDGLGYQSRYMRTTYNYGKMKKKYLFSSKKTFVNDPYKEGAIFFGHLDHLLDGGMKSFLKLFYTKYNQMLYTQELFFEELSLFALDFYGKAKKNKVESLVQKYFL